MRGRRTAGYVTVAQTLAYAERASGGRFRFAGARAELRPGEPFARVRLCYRLDGAPPECGIEYVVSDSPPHVELADRNHGLGRELEHGRERFVFALGHEIALRRDPSARALRDALDPFNPYDDRP